MVIYCGDAIEVLNSLEPGSVDMVVADPPYHLSNGGFTCKGGKRAAVKKGDWDASQGVGNDFEFHRAWLHACGRVLKDTGTLWVFGTYHSIYQCGYALQLGGWHILNDVCWFKPNAAPNLSCRMFTASHETIIWAKKTKTAKHIFNYQAMKNGEWDDRLKNPGKQMRSVWAVTPPKKSEKVGHPTQKPLALLERIILAGSVAGDVVLDPFCGSGTTGEAALKHGRDFIGIDNDPQWVEVSKKRAARILVP